MNFRKIPSMKLRHCAPFLRFICSLFSGDSRPKYGFLIEKYLNMVSLNVSTTLLIYTVFENSLIKIRLKHSSFDAVYFEIVFNVKKKYSISINWINCKCSMGWSKFIYLQTFTTVLTETSTKIRNCRIT